MVSILSSKILILGLQIKVVLHLGVLSVRCHLKAMLLGSSWSRLLGTAMPLLALTTVSTMPVLGHIRLGSYSGQPLVSSAMLLGKVRL